jgi:hypothetical protein
MVDGCWLRTTSQHSTLNTQPVSNLNHLPKSVTAHWKTELCDKVLSQSESQISNLKSQILSTSEVRPRRGGTGPVVSP